MLYDFKFYYENILTKYAVMQCYEYFKCDYSAGYSKLY